MTAAPRRTALLVLTTLLLAANLTAGAGATTTTPDPSRSAHFTASSWTQVLHAATPAPAPGPVPGGSPASFVTKQGTSLTLDGRPFRFSGANLYWTGLDENVGGIDPAGPRAVAYPSAFRIRDGLTTAAAMGATVVRAHTLGISTGTPLSLEPTFGTTNPAAFASMDETVAEAKRLGLRLVVPLTDNWQYYHGGRYDVLRWLGLSTADNGRAFYTAPAALTVYESHVRTLLAHVNPRTGLSYAADPTIMAWELGNELDSATPQWVQAAATFVKQQAPRQLVAAGRSWSTDPAVLASPAVDISDSHYYPLDLAKVRTDAAAATAAGKVFVIGEYASTSISAPVLAALAADPRVSGAAFWSLFPHADHYGFVQHDDGYTLHAPGDTATMRAQVAAVTAFGRAMGAPVAPVAPVVGDPPLVTAVTPGATTSRTLTWRGTAGAAGYRVLRTSASTGARWTTGVGQLPGTVFTWTDPSTPTDPAEYRVTAIEAGGRELARSAPVVVARGQRLTVDPLEDWYVTSERSPSLRRTATATGVSVAPPAGQPGSAAWAGSSLASATFDVAAGGRPSPAVQARWGAGAWRAVPTTVTTITPGRYAVSAGGLAGATGVRFGWPAGAGTFSLTRATLVAG